MGLNDTEGINLIFSSYVGGAQDDGVSSLENTGGAVRVLKGSQLNFRLGNRVRNQ